MSSGKYIDDLLDKYSIDGDFVKTSGRLFTQPGVQNLIEKAERITAESGPPTLKEFVGALIFAGSELPKPIAMALLSMFVRTLREVEALKEGRS